MVTDYEELKNKIREEFDEIQFLEKFNVTLDDLISAFEDRIEERAEELEQEFELSRQYDDIGNAFVEGIYEETDEN